MFLEVHVIIKLIYELWRVLMFTLRGLDFGLALKSQFVALRARLACLLLFASSISWGFGEGGLGPVLLDLYYITLLGVTWRGFGTVLYYKGGFGGGVLLLTKLYSIGLREEEGEEGVRKGRGKTDREGMGKTEREGR